MKYDVGLLADKPHDHRSHKWMKKGDWHNPNFPADVRTEIAVWLAMPGFDYGYHRRSFGMTDRTFRKMKNILPQYEELKPLVIENWLSATRQDCIRICHNRTGVASSIPLLSQLAILDEVKRGVRKEDVARLFRVTGEKVHQIIRHGPSANYGTLPAEFLVFARQSPIPDHLYKNKV